jgi:hypothetical protein
MKFEVGLKLIGLVIPPKVIQCAPLLICYVTLNLTKLWAGRLPSPFEQSIGGLLSTGVEVSQLLPFHAGSTDFVHSFVCLLQ